MKLKIKHKIILPFLAIFTGLTASHMYISSKISTDASYTSLYEKLDTDWKYIDDLLKLEYGDNWSIKEKNMYRGNTNLGDGTLEKSLNDVFDYHLKATGTWSLVFMREYGVENDLKYVEDKGYYEGPYLRVAGSTRDAAGNRVIGTRIQKQVADAVEANGEYKGESNVAGGYIYCIYRPLKDANGETVGIMVVGRNSDDVRGIVNSLRLKTGIVTILVLLLGSLIFVTIVSNLTKRIQQIIKQINDFKNGDLKARCIETGTDEVTDIAIGANHMFVTLSELFENMENTATQLSLSSESLKTSTEVVDNSGQEITITISELAEGISNQVDNLENAAKLTENLSVKLNTLLDESFDMNSLSNEINETNKVTIDAVLNLKEKTLLSDSATTNIEDAVGKLSVKTKNIESILSTITYIADKTNLLSLNSSIEAARVGEAGKGFSVLAVETGNLAKASSDAVQEIETIIKEIKADVENSIKAVQNVKVLNNEQSDSFNSVNKSFNKISEYINNINDKIENINAFIQEINTDKEVILNAITKVFTVSEKSAASTEEVMSTIEEQFNKIRDLKEEANKLDELAKKLKEIQ